MAERTRAASRSSQGRRFDIQGMRALAVLAVVAYHAGLPVPGGFVGVDVFFVVSGFVITQMLVRGLADHGRVRFGYFYLRRFKRLTPALAVMVAVVALASIVLLAPFGTQQIAAKTGTGAILLVANIVLAKGTGGYFDAPSAGNPFLHTWSLSVEEQFYLIYPAVLALSFFLSRKSQRLRHAPAIIIGGITLASLILTLVGPGGFPSMPWVLGFYSPIVRAWEFGVGALVALSFGAIERHLRNLTSLASVVGAIAIFSSFWLINDLTTFPGTWTLLPVVGTALLLAAGVGNSPINRVLALKPFVAVGDWSYSIYLWHWPFIVFARALWPDTTWAMSIAAILSIPVALLSYYVVEQPIRSRKISGASTWIKIIATTAIPTLVICVGLRTGANHGWGIAKVQQSAGTGADAHIGYVDCMTEATNGGSPAANPTHCTFGAAATGAPVYLVGDSNAAQYSEAVIGAGRTLARPVTISAAAACPFFDVYEGSKGKRSTSDTVCRTYYETTMAALAHKKRGTVIISESASQWLLPGRSVGLTPSALLSDDNGRAAVIKTGLQRTVSTLKAMGNQVLLVLPMYWFGDISTPVTLPSCTTMLSVIDGSCPREIKVSSMSIGQQQARSTVARIAASSGESSLDLLLSQCPGGVCQAYQGKMPMYADTGHISSDLSASMSSKFAGALKAAGS